MTDFVLLLPVLLFSVVAHEYAHAWTALREGDPTAYMLGRLTLNPLPHLDPVMSVVVPVVLWFASSGAFTFGAAKPVPVNARNFRHYRRGDIIVSSAGIAMNLLLAVICAGAFVVLGVLGQALPAAAGVLRTLQRMALFGILLNYILAVFNLVPLPPLDGSHLLYHALPPRWGLRYLALGRMGFLLIAVLFLVPQVWSVLLWPAELASHATIDVIRSFALPGTGVGAAR